MKKRIFLGIISLLLIQTVFSKEEEKKEEKITWEKISIENIISNARFLLTDGRIIEIANIKICDKTNPEKNYQCLGKMVTEFLKEKLEDKTLKIKKQHRQKKQGAWQVDIKTNKENLRETLIKNGFAKIENPKLFSKRIQELEITTKKERKGLWGNCEKSTTRRILKREIKKEYQKYFSPISVGIVEKVISGKEIKLKNGPKIELLGLDVPSPEDGRPMFACFVKHSKQKLESKILNKKIFLIKENSELSPERKFLRHIFLPLEDTGQTELFINQEMIEEGFAKSFWRDNQDPIYQKTFKEKELEAYKQMKGAWGWCLWEILNKEDKKTESLVYDSTCPIKGNISGNKKKPVKTYHTPKSGWYKRIKQEECFETEAAAENAGFTKVK